MILAQSLMEEESGSSSAALPMRRGGLGGEHLDAAVLLSSVVSKLVRRCGFCGGCEEGGYVAERRKAGPVLGL